MKGYPKRVRTLSKLACLLLSLVLVGSSPMLRAQHISSLSAPLPSSIDHSITGELQKKIVSGQLLQHRMLKMNAAHVAGITPAATSMAVAIYSAQYPSTSELASLERLGVRCMPGSWIPPLEHHPLGFYIAGIPVDKLVDVLSLPSVLKMDSAEGESVPQNNLAAIAAKATLAWAGGWTGTGVKVGVIDSGLDYTLPKTELPDSLWYRNYAYYPDSVNNDVGNMVSAHGTHVTGTVLGKGGFSTSPVLNTGNGGGAYKGMAPDANLVFLKIGNNTTSSATEAAMVAAIKSAADSFQVKIINMSYGGWEAFHDGSDAKSQATDYAYSKGVACFYSAGNEGGSARHYSGTIAAGSTTGDIQVTVAGAGSNNTALFFYLIWADGSARNNLSLQYFDASHNPLSNLIYDVTRESPRGTESQFSYYNVSLPSGSGTYYLRVSNPSSSSQFFHLYEAWGNGAVKFAAPDPQYTITSPATADHAFAVAAYTTRTSWTDSLGEGYTYGNTLDQIAPFSSRGPRIDGMQKPNITAPGSAIISIRDRYVPMDYKLCIDNDGVTGGNANYCVMQGTSMASPVTTGCATLLLQHSPNATPQVLYDAITNFAVVDATTGLVPNSTWGYGKLDIQSAIQNTPLPVELVAFNVSARAGSAVLSWHTATEVNNYGFEVERRSIISPLASSAALPAASWSKIGFVPGYGTANTPHQYAFTDQSAASTRYAYRLKQVDKDGRFEYSREVEMPLGEMPLQYALGQNYPNPFNPLTTIGFTVAKASPVRLSVYDLLGRETAVLVQEKLEAGSYRAEWDASRCASGVYFYRIDAGTYSAVKKLLLQK
jgi:hypothetical protein